MEWLPEADLLARVLVAALLGTVVGFERERDGHPAGTRTFAAVAAGAALLGVVSTTGFTEFVTERSETNVRVDVTRVASQVVVGIGFLGAGLIFRRGGTVQNLTTAATLWAVAAVGLAAGVGLVGLAVAVVGVLVVLLAAVPTVQRVVEARAIGLVHQVRLELASVGAIEGLHDHLAALGEPVLSGWRLSKDQGQVVVDVWLRSRHEAAMREVVDGLVRDAEVVGCRVVS